MDFTLTPEQEAFRERVRTWLKANNPADWQRKVGSSDVPRPEAYEFLRRWQRQLYDAGFIGLTWPEEAGAGTGTVLCTSAPTKAGTRLSTTTSAPCSW